MGPLGRHGTTAIPSEAVVIHLSAESNETRPEAATRPSDGVVLGLAPAYATSIINIIRPDAIGSRRAGAELRRSFYRLKRLWTGISGTAEQGSGPARPLRIAFQDLCYSVPAVGGGRRGDAAQLLKGLSGCLEPGQMTAVMGPSGGGKTTFLDVCAGRKTLGTTTGTLLYGSSPPTKALLRRCTGYVEQNDTLLEALTVREMLLYTAELKRPTSELFACKAAAVDALIERLALSKCRDTPIGSAMARGISGGQAKRTNVGIALITNPRVLFLDEPTSGLDSFTALEVMSVVRALAADGTVLCATIHSPSAACFALFDRVMVLASGWLVYGGDAGAAAARYVSEVCGAPPLAFGQNLSEYIVDFMAQVGQLVNEADHEGRSQDMHALYTDSVCAKTTLLDLDSYIAAAAAAAGTGDGGKAPWRPSLRRLQQPPPLRSPSTILAGGSFLPGAEKQQQEVELLQHSAALPPKSCHGHFSSSADLTDAGSVGETPSLEAAAPVVTVAADSSTSGSNASASASAAELGKGGGGGGAAAASAAVGVSVPCGAAAKAVAGSDDGDRDGDDGGSRSGDEASGGVRGWCWRSSEDQYVTPAWWGLRVLLQYRTLRSYRSMSYLGARLYHKAAFALFIMSLYFGIARRFTAANIPAMAAVLYLCVGQVVLDVCAYVPNIVLDRALFVREHHDGLYRPITYLVFKVIEELVLAYAVGLIQSVIIFFGVGLQGSFLYFWMMLMAEFSAGIGIAYTIAALVSSLDVANAAVPSLLTALIFLSGFPVRFDAVPVYWRWTFYANPVRYAWGGLIINQFEGQPEAMMGSAPVLQYNSLDGQDKWEFVGIVAAIFVGWLFLAWMALAYVKHHRR